MTKEADKRALEEEEAAKSAERRRKRRGGLRIPSDNVPRATDGDVSAPIPEDPKLAVSVAVAFGGSAAASAKGSVTAPSEIPTELDDDEFDDDEGFDEEASSEFDAELADARAQAFDNERSDVDGIPVPGDDDLSGPELFIDRGDTDEGADSLDDDPALDDLDEVSASSPPAPESASAGPAVGLGALAGDDSVHLPSGAASGDSVEIAFDDEDIAQSARDVGGMSEPAPAPSNAAAPSRAQTVALTEEDLEEVMEEVGGELAEIMAATRAREAAASRPAEAADEPHGDSAGARDVDSRRTEPMPAVAAPPGLSLEGRTESAPATAPEPVSVAPQATPAGDHDAGDSGEIISEDLLEEVDDVAQPAPPPVPEGSSEAEAAQSPPPAPARKPPPAPRAQAAAASAGKSRRRRGKPWFEEIFEEDYLRTLPFLTPQATQSEARFVADSLLVEPGAQILDVGCGYGRHSMELAARGYHVVALDASLPLLLRGADEAQRRGLDINFVHGDMRELTFDSQFDGAYCLFSTFGFFDDETNKLTAQNIARALKPGARFVVEVLNRDYLIADLPSRVWWEGDGCVVLEEVEFNYFSSRIVSNRSVVFDDGRQLEQEISIRAYSLHEFGKLLHAAGFRVIEISGSMVTRGRFFGGHSRDIIVVAERRGPSGTNGDGK